MEKASRNRQLLLTIAILTGIVFTIIVIVRPAWSRPGMAPGFDAASFIFSSKFLADKILTNHSIPQINPYWYNGFELLHNAPALAYILLGLLYLIFRNPELVSKLGQIVIMIGISISMFLVLYKKHGLLAAAVGSFILVLAPMTIWEVVASGSYHRIMGLIFYPPAFYFANEIAEGRKTLRSLGLLVLFQSLAILSHPMVGAGLVLFLSAYLIIFLVLDAEGRKIPVLGYWVTSLVLTLTLTGWYLGPFFIEKIGWTSLPEEIYKQNSVPLLRMIYLIGLPSLLLAIYGVARRKSAVGKALLLTAFLAMLVALGSRFSSVTYALAQIMYPFVALYFATFALSYLAAVTVGNKSLMKNPIFSGVVVVLLVSLVLMFVYRDVPEYVRLSGAYFNEKEQEALARLRSLPYGGRVMPMKYPFTYLIWWIPVRAEKPLVEGWFYSLTPTGREIAWIYDAIDRGFPEYSVKVLNRMNVQYLITNGNFDHGGRQYQKFLNLMKGKGFDKTFENVAYTVYVKKSDATYLRPLGERILAIGKHSSTIAQIIPEAVASQSIYIDDFDLDALKLFDTVVLSGFGYRNQKKAEELVKQYVKNGGKVVADLAEMEGNPFEENPGFLGVTPVPSAVKGRADFQELEKDPALEGFDLSNSNFSYEGEEWKTISYAGLDKKLLKLKSNGNSYDILGYQRIDGHKVYFVGANLFYHAYLNHNEAELRLIRNVIKNRSKKPGPGVTINQKLLEPENIKFTYASTDQIPVIVSYAWSPHWKAYVDGKEIKVYNIEDLIFLSLPKGKHFVEVKYGNTPIHYYANSISALTLLFLGFLVYRERRKLSAKEGA